MAHMIEQMFSVREKPWHGLGTIVMEAPASADALRLAGLDWNVVQESVYTDSKEKVEGYKLNIRDSDRKVLGVVSDRYRVVQNVDAFSFTDGLLGKGVRYETAGSLQNGKRVWLLARLPKVFFVNHFSLKKAFKFPFFIQGNSLFSAGTDHASWRIRACSIR